MEFTLIDALLFVVGMAFGIVFGFYTGKLIFRTFFKRYEDAITVENADKFEGIQQIVNYALGFALVTMTLDPTLSTIFFILWLGFQTWLALRVFGFPEPIHGLTYSLIDTAADLAMGVVFGAGAATYTLSYLRDMVNAARVSGEVVTLELDTDMPIRLDFELSQGKLVYYLAPCIGA